MESTTGSVPSAIVVPPAAAARCANCDAPRIGPYCQGCGQHHIAEPLEIRTLARDFLERQLSLEGGLTRTVVDLTIRPGPMIRDYLAGKRQRYMNPVAYTLLSATLYVLLLPLWIDRFRAESMAGLEGASDAEEMSELMVAMMSHPIVVTLLTLVVFIPALRAVFPGRLTLAEAAVFSLYTFAHASVVGTLLTPLLLLLPGGSMQAMSSASMVVWTLLLINAAGGFFGYWPGTFLRILGAGALGMLGTMALIIVFGIGYVLLRLAGA
jgi:hypothetical protein